MKAIFIADAHLWQAKSVRYQALSLFLNRILADRGAYTDLAIEPQGYLGQNAQPQTLAIDSLFVIGDFFDFWFARNRHVYPDFVPIVERLIALKDHGIAISIYEGNHDFFLNDYFGLCLGMTVVQESSTLDMDGLRIYVAHGDTVDQENRGYLRLRRLLRSIPVYRLQKRLPLRLLWRVAQLGSRVSKEWTSGSREALVGKMEAFSINKFNEGFDAVILGHCHEPVLKEYVIGGRRRIFSTLGDWIAHYSYLHYSDGRFSLARFRP
ncbi:MAG: UDP-2,3-diacylglucosamine diphosphatase [Syntrophales bacterium LBB04]|nr:UDP-2,3-diacylglucosamine diphosphatase [Syntrophales bacterium LBB04]